MIGDLVLEGSSYFNGSGQYHSQIDAGAVVEERVPGQQDDGRDFASRKNRAGNSFELGQSGPGLIDFRSQPS